MPNTPVPAAGGAMPRADAAAFVLACRLAGHRAYVSNDIRFAIELNHYARRRPEPEHPLGADRRYPQGFDDRPFLALFARDDHLAPLIEAAREFEARLAAMPKGARP
jgi:hypothetical protein